MTSTTLTDQMGAMALVDDLRHRQMHVQEYLDLPKRRAEVARKISDYYSAQGITVDQALVDQGVHDYFNRRLTFEVPGANAFENWLARAYLTRDRWLRALFVGVGVAVTINLSIAGAQHWSDSRKNAAVEKVVEAAASQLQAARAKHATLMKLSASLKEGVLRAPAATLIASADVKIQQAEEILRIVAVPKTEVTTENRDHLRLSVAQQVAIPLTRVEQDLDEAQAELQRAAESGRATELESNLVDVMKAFNAMPLNAIEREQVSFIESRMKQQLQVLDTAGAAGTLKELVELKAFAEKPLEVNIVDRTGVRSGVERNYDETGGKSWYAIVEATDRAGSVIAVPVTSGETGERRWTELYGVQITADEYQRLKEDKMADGHLEETEIGSKAEGSLTINYNQVTDKPGFILEW